MSEQDSNAEHRFPDEIPWYERRGQITTAREVPRRSAWRAVNHEGTDPLWSGVSILVCALALFGFVQMVSMPVWLASVLQGIALCVLMTGILVIGGAMGQRQRRRRREDTPW